MFGLFKKKITILMVCSANICRSPTAQGLMNKIVRERGLGGDIRVDSAGTHASRIRGRPDSRAQQVARESGFSIARYKSRILEETDYSRYDYIVAMDKENLQYMKQKCPPEFGHKLLSIMDYSPNTGLDEIPDPYFGNLAGFERVITLLRPACMGLLEHLLDKHGLS